MGTLNNPGAFDCLTTLDPDEEYFLLRAKDASMPGIVQAWARQRRREIELGLKPKSDMAKVEEALQCADRAYHWRQKQAVTPPVTPEKETSNE